MLLINNSVMHVNQNLATTKIQKSPAFNGKVYLIAEDLSKAPSFDAMTNSFAKTLVMDHSAENLSEGNKGLVSFIFKNFFNAKVKSIVKEWNEKLLPNKNIIAKFEE